MSKKLLILLCLILAFSFSANYGDNYLYPKLTSNQKGYYEIIYNEAFFNIGGTNNLFNSLTFTQFLEEDFILSLQKKYISNKLTLGFLYKYFVSAEYGEIGMGIRNLGCAYADTNAPYPQEYILYQIYSDPFYINFGGQRMVDKGPDFFVMFGGIETKVWDNINLFAYYDYGYFGAGFTFPWSEQIKVSLTGYGLANGMGGDSKVLELGFTLLNFTKSGAIVQQDTTGGNKLTSEVIVKLKNQENQINILKAKMNSMEYIYSEQFQKKLVNEIVSQKIVEKELRENETLLLKVTMKHLQQGLEYYYLHDYEKSFQEYKIANSLYPNMPLIHESLGSIYYTLSKFEEAKREWLLALSLNPESEEAKTQIKKLKGEHPELFEVSGGVKNEK